MNIKRFKKIVQTNIRLINKKKSVVLFAINQYSRINKIYILYRNR